MASFPAACQRPWLLPTLAAVACYAITLNGTFVYDDVELILHDPRMTDPARWRELLTASYNGGEDNLYRPLVTLSFYLQHRLHGPVAWPFHLVNLALHALATLAVVGLARRLAGPSDDTSARFVATVAGLLFAVHPLHVEAVAGIYGRAELLCVVGVCLSLARAIEPTGRRDLAVIVLGFLLALLSKEHALILPVLLGAWFGARRLVNGPLALEQRRHGAIAFVSTSVLLAIYVATRQAFLKFDWDRSFLDWTIQPLILAGPLDRWTLPLELLGRYVALLIAPVHLSIDHGYAVLLHRVRWESIYPWLGIVVAACWLAWVGISIARKSAASLFLALASAISLAIPLQLVGIIGTIFGERLMYLPSVFLLIAAAMLLRDLPRRVRVPPVALIVLAWSARSIVYAAEWSDRLAFYDRSLQRQPTSIRLLMLTAHENQQQGHWPRGEVLLLRARTIAPRYDEPLIRMAIFAAERGEFQLARRRLDAAMNLQPRVKTTLLYGYIDRLEREKARGGD